MFSKSKRFGENIHGASGPGPATYKMKHLFDDAGAQQPKQRARKPQVLPMLLGKMPSMVLCKKPPCKGWLAKGATGMFFFWHPESTRNASRLETSLETKL